MGKLRKIPSRISRFFILKLEFIDGKLYRRAYTKWLKKQGVIIHGTPNYISNTAYLDGSNYKMIEIGDGCTISRDVLLLTHDYSMHTVFQGVKSSHFLENDLTTVLERADESTNLLDQRPIHIGNYSFIGARACLLPGTTIGNNCIIGAGSVVKGNVPDDSILIGNPAKLLMKTSEWLEKKGNTIAKQEDKQ